MLSGAACLTRESDPLKAGSWSRTLAQLALPSKAGTAHSTDAGSGFHSIALWLERVLPNPRDPWYPLTLNVPGSPDGVVQPDLVPA